MSNLIYNVDTVREVLDQCSIKVHTVSLLPNIEVVIGIVKVVHPMIL